MAGAAALLCVSDDDMSTDHEGEVSGDKKIAVTVPTPLQAKAGLKRAMADPESGGQMKAQRGRGKGAGKSSKNRSDDEEWKKCSMCKKFLPESQFYSCQASCISCSLTLKSMRRVATGQGNAKWLRELEHKDPDGFSQLVKEYSKERENRTKRCRTKFSFTAYRETYVAQSGLRTEHIGEMMWRNEFIDWAKGAKMGYLTESEAALQWEQMLLEPKRKRDVQDLAGISAYGS